LFENLAGMKGELVLGVKVDEVVRDKRDGLEA
jgi:hypothetical protein